jgi:predicted ArsR family transcriptional regulator
MDYPDLERRLVALASLVDPVRRALYQCVVARDEEMGRDEAAAAVGVSRALAAYHLDKLAEAGLLDTRFQRRTGRAWPAAGRPAKLYLRSRSPIEVALPARNYQLIAQLLAHAVQADQSVAVHADEEPGGRGTPPVWPASWPSKATSRTTTTA